MNKTNFSDDYFLLTNNTISLLFMCILWNKSGRKYLHTLRNAWLTRTWLVVFDEDMAK